MDISQNSKIVGRISRNTAERQASSAIQADSSSAQALWESWPPLPEVVKRRRKWRLHATSSAVPALHDLPLPPLQLSQRSLQSSINCQSSPSPHNQSNPKSDKQQRLSLSTHPDMIPAPPIPPPQSDLVRSHTRSIDTGDVVIASREDLLDRSAILPTAPVASQSTGASSQVTQAAPIRAPHPTSSAFSTHPSPLIADPQPQFGATPSTQLLSTSVTSCTQFPPK